MNVKSIKNTAIKLKQGFRFSHLICLSIGILIPIYADVLFLHEFNSSTVSAIMDTVMATAAISAALSVRDWLKDKLKNKGFEQTHQIISDVYMMMKIFNSLENQCSEFTDKHFSGMDLGTSEETLKRDAIVLRELSKQTSDKSIELIIALKSLPIWGMNCKREEEIIKYLDSINDLCDIVVSITAKEEGQSFFDRVNIWESKKSQFEKVCMEVVQNFHRIGENYDELFTYEPRKMTVK